ncbi:fumble-domain-containing protein, partial [Endogone sp. FLAS-F59071]
MFGFCDDGFRGNGFGNDGSVAMSFCSNSLHSNIILGSDQKVKVEDSDETVLLTAPANKTKETLDEEEAASTLFKGHLTWLRSSPNMYGALTVRSLLNLREQCLRELGFPDIFWKVKRVENQAALRGLRGMLAFVDAIKDERGRVKLLIENILAGNMFDWGSNQILKLLKSGLLNFEEAKNRVRLPESSQFNTLDAFLDRVVSSEHRYRKVVFFVDNSGADIVLGVLPFARYLLCKGAEVILAANSFPAVNDVTLGGGTLWGLLSLLTGAQTFDEMLDASQNGDNRNVDMLVGDIYGTDYSRIGLKSSTIASSFGKVFKRNVKREQGAFKNEDISRSLLYMVSNNIGQIAYLNAEKHGLKRIYFGGCFIRGHPITMNTLSYAIGFWSKGQMKALFLRHEGHLGAVGAFLKHHPIKRERHSFSFSENFTLSQKISGESHIATGVLERTNRLTSFPLLDDSVYMPDTFELVEPQAQRYWIDILESGMDHLVEMAAQWEGEAVREKGGGQVEDADETVLLTAPANKTKETLDEEEKIRSRLAQFSTLFKGHLTWLRSSPNMYGALTVRSLLNLREQCLRELGFPDI